MKKFLLLLISSLLLVGCATQKSNTLKTVALEPVVEPLLVTADLAVSEQKATGEASGKVAEKAQLEKEALARALGQEPPSVDKPDVLVGMNVFTEIHLSDLKLTVTGYPAYYTNFRTANEDDLLRLNIAKLDRKAPSLDTAQAIQPKSKSGLYFAPKYQLPFSEGVGYSNIDLEFGWVWENEAFLGLDLNFSPSIDFDDRPFTVGGGLNFGRAFDIDPFQAVVGASAGFWLISHEEPGFRVGWSYNNLFLVPAKNNVDNIYVFAPFVKARWSVLELMYRIFPSAFGIDNLVSSNVTKEWSHQFMVGFYIK